MCKDQSRPVYSLDDVGHRKGLARTGHAKQDLFVKTVVQAVYQGLDRPRLVSGSLVIRMKNKLIHGADYTMDKLK